MAAGLSSNMGSMFGLQFGDEADHRRLHCLWSEASIFEPALTKNTAVELTWCVLPEGAGAGSTHSAWSMCASGSRSASLSVKCLTWAVL